VVGIVGRGGNSGRRGSGDHTASVVVVVKGRRGSGVVSLDKELGTEEK